MASNRQSSWAYCLTIKKTTASAKSDLFVSVTHRACSFKTLKLKVSSCKGSSNAESSSPNSSDSPENSIDRVKLALGRAKEYKKSLISKKIEHASEDQEGELSESKSENGGSVSGEGDGGKKKALEAVRVSFENAKEYKKNKGILGSSNLIGESEKLPGLKGENGSNLRKGNDENIVTKKELKISSIDFMGLDFADKKKTRGLPAGLIPIGDPFPEDDLPEVELLVGDADKFGNSTPWQPKKASEENLSLYKPKVSTWGVFPRPRNISKTFGGGRIIRPGEALETSEDKAAKEAHTRELLAAYKNKIGLNIDAELKAECEKALKDGDSLMDLGKLKEALPYYQKVMDKLAFRSEIHGLAALQWSICQDSLNRPDEARVMYEKLQSHPNAQVSKKARQLIFGFQAMEMMRERSSAPRHTGFDKLFDAFVEDEDGFAMRNNESEGDAPLTEEALQYLVILAAPILIVLLLITAKIRA
ncbi:hypothetical protein Nepgr_023299 [Nepenthes gracilis]|uniref:Uncharacterized protein n=1 Tax=Nepenthes gracilis TaxID=150966 RepID=A0AAD3T2B7_NEPGR|nr:hypothetical protein Nepgr_023299 [Nepenthes gracilis]